MLEATDFTLPGHEADGGLTVALMRYRPATNLNSHAVKERLSLIFAHGVSNHKESWKPTIEQIFRLQAAAPDGVFRVLEAWCIDSPNHGRAAVINEQRLQTRPPGMSAYEWGRAVQVLLKAGLIAGNAVIGIGHSAGTCVIILSAATFPESQLPYRSMILIEPPMMNKETIKHVMQPNSSIVLATKFASKRKDVWPSRTAAREWLAKRMPWNRWEPEALDLYVEYALRDLPTAKYPDITEGVTLSCTREQEYAGYIYHQDGLDSLEKLGPLSQMIPVHCIFSGTSVMVSDEMQQVILNEKEGRKMATIKKIPGAGHAIPQEDPKGLASAIWAALRHDYEPRSRL
ncbi:alpha/beta-hydrolase [Punctularia strigosozonata HHB-11173 SS5]|uniref:alpha/beta-hydrolase n=1 Tax=Punctularia strigosozonata (strain HHB-11173) TaxID=741275 RepID=UPI0004416A68|nr:alpha/beta-hydrolase [Punctularia strigosozonata HHB-11173 SS5]EIN09722.1 alpha/beta-hydrolase [Punctularia strigosozonata HHB-11173 SS5]